jgi:hypothetical protein
MLASPGSYSGIIFVLIYNLTPYLSKRLDNVHEQLLETTAIRKQVLCASGCTRFKVSYKAWNKINSKEKQCKNSLPRQFVL